MKHPWFSVSLAAVMIAVIAGDLFALAGRLDRPGISIPVTEAEGVETPHPVVQSIHKVLAKKDWTFAGGYFVNWSSWLRYRGDATDLSAFLKALSEVDGAKLTIRFTRDPAPFISAQFEGEKANDDLQWAVTHVAMDDQATEVIVSILIGENGVDLEQLTLPTIRGNLPK